MVFLSSDVPRWLPSDEEGIVDAIESGLLAESHYLDLKASIPPGSSKNRELARDLASFAVDGGALLIGVAEAELGALKTSPVELEGLAERVEQVARSIPDPPLPVTCRAIPAAAAPGLGYLLVEIPATGTAPHMVDGVYMGRGDKTKVRLTDAEVLRLHQSRSNERDLMAHLLDQYVSRDPIPKAERRQAHGFVVAYPVRPRPEMLLAVRPDGRWETVLHRLLDQGAHTSGTVIEQEASYEPSLRRVGTFARRADGAALTHNLSEGREQVRWHDDRPPSEDVIELEVTEEGGIRVMTTRLGDEVAGRGQVVFEDILPDLTRRTVGMAAMVCDLTGYAGTWTFGVAATGIAGKSAFGSGRVNMSTLGTFGADQPDYRAYTEAATLELRATPGAVTGRLVGRFLRSIGFENAPRVRPFLED